MKKMLMAVLAMLLVGSCSKMDGAPEPQTDEEKAFYALGAMMASRLKDMELTDKELALVKAGLNDAAKGKQLAVEPSKHQFKIQEMFNARLQKKAEKVKKEGEDYLEEFVKKEGAQKTESGLAYKVLKEGSGKKPKETDEVEVHYHGTLTNGEVFDSSVQRGKTVKFPLNRVIKGWTEGLQLIGEGGKVKLVIPSELGYGDHGAPPKIPGGSTLVFEVELFKVNPTDEEASKPAAKGKKKK